MIRRSLSAAAVALFLAAPVLAAATPWTAGGPAAVIDESSVPLYAVTPPYLGFSSTAGNGVINAYFNVTDTTATSAPGWTTLEINYFDNHPQSQVTATLYRVDKCGGTATSICTAVSTDAAANNCARCYVNAALDFDLYYYYVGVTIYRSSTSLAPKLYGVRLYN